MWYQSKITIHSWVMRSIKLIDDCVEHLLLILAKCEDHSTITFPSFIKICHKFSFLLNIKIKCVIEKKKNYNNINKAYNNFTAYVMKVVVVVCRVSRKPDMFIINFWGVRVSNQLSLNAVEGEVCDISLTYSTNWGPMSDSVISDFVL